MQKKILAGFDGIIELHTPVVESVHLLRKIVYKVKKEEKMLSHFYAYYCFFFNHSGRAKANVPVGVCKTFDVPLLLTLFWGNQGVGSDDP